MGCESFCFVAVSARVPDPSAFITKMSAEPVRPLTNAIFVPSADHAGSTWKKGDSPIASSSSAAVSLRSPSPFAAMTKIAYSPSRLDTNARSELEGSSPPQPATSAEHSRASEARKERTN